MRHFTFCKLIDSDVRHKDLFDTASIWTQVADERNDTLFYRRKVRIFHPFPKEETDLIFQAFQELGLVIKLNKACNKHDESIYHLRYKKIDSCLQVCEYLEKPFSYIYKHFPRYLKRCNTSFLHCPDCAHRCRLIKLFVDRYGMDWHKDNIIHYYFPDNEVKTRLRIKDSETSLPRRLTDAEKKNFLDLQEVLVVLDEHYKDKVKSDGWWDELLHENSRGFSRIPVRVCIVIVDHMTKTTLGENTKQPPGKKKNSTSQMGPLGVAFIYRDSITGKTKRLYRIVFPDSFATTSFQVITCLQKLLRPNQNSDPQLFELLENTTKLIVTFISIF